MKANVGMGPRNRKIRKEAAEMRNFKIICRNKILKDEIPGS